MLALTDIIVDSVVTPHAVIVLIGSIEIISNVIEGFIWIEFKTLAEQEMHAHRHTDVW